MNLNHKKWILIKIWFWIRVGFCTKIMICIKMIKMWIWIKLIFTDFVQKSWLLALKFQHFIDLWTDDLFRAKIQVSDLTNSFDFLVKYWRFALVCIIYTSLTNEKLKLSSIFSSTIFCLGPLTMHEKNSNVNWIAKRSVHITHMNCNESKDMYQKWSTKLDKHLLLVITWRNNIVWK